jgi:hypothetical protein
VNSRIGNSVSFYIHRRMCKQLSDQILDRNQKRIRISLDSSERYTKDKKKEPYSVRSSRVKLNKQYYVRFKTLLGIRTLHRKYR